MSPLISIIVPVYNHGHFLSDALSSVQSQTIKDWECLIVDDGSPDDAALIAKYWVDKDSRFLYFHKKNEGLSSARNFGLNRAQGQFIQFLDADDVIFPNKIDFQLSKISDGPLHSLSFCDYAHGAVDDIYSPPVPSVNKLPTVIGESFTIYDLAADWETRLTIPAHSFLFNRIFFDEGIRFDESLANHEDWDCWMKIFSKASFVDFCPETLVIYRYSKNSMSRDLLKMRDGYLQAIDKHLSSDWHCREVKAILRTKRAEMNLSYELALRRKAIVIQVFVMCYKAFKKIFRVNRANS